MTMRAASIKSLMEIKDVTREDAKRIRAIWKAVKTDDLLDLFPGKREEMLDRILSARGHRQYRSLQRQLIDEIVSTCGVEHLGYCNIANRHIYYCNGGDSYAITVCFVGDSLTVSTMAYYAERRGGMLESIQ